MNSTQPPPDVKQPLGPTQRKQANLWNASFFNGRSLRPGRVPPEILRLPGFLAALDRDLAARPPLERTTGNQGYLLRNNPRRDLQGIYRVWSWILKKFLPLVLNIEDVFKRISTKLVDEL